MPDNKDQLCCVVCGKHTMSIFNIKFKATPICECCADDISLQHVKDIIHKRGVDED